MSSPKVQEPSVRRGGLHQAHLAQLVAWLGLNFDVHRFDFRDRQIPLLVVGYWFNFLYNSEIARK